MKLLVITASPNDNGWTTECANTFVDTLQAKLDNVNDVSVSFDYVSLYDLTIAPADKLTVTESGQEIYADNDSQVSSDDNFADDFALVYNKICDADTVILCTPVYWNEPSDQARLFMLRMHQYVQLGNTDLHGKSAVLIATASGSGMGIDDCLHELQQWADYVGLLTFAAVAADSKKREISLQNIRDTAVALLAVMSGQ